MHQVFDISDQLVEIDDLGTVDLLPRIGEKLPNEMLASLRSFHCSLRKRLDFFGIALSARDEFEIADDNRQKIVEIMRDSTGQLTDSL